MTNDAKRVSAIVAVAWRVVGLAGPLHAAITGNPETAEGWRASNFQVEPLYTADIIEAQSKALAEARSELWHTALALGVIAKWPRFYFNRFYVEEWVLRTVVILRRWGVREPDAALTVHGGKSIKKSRLASALTPTPENPNG